MNMNLLIQACRRQFTAGPSRPSVLTLTSTYRAAAQRPSSILSHTRIQLHTLSRSSIPSRPTPSFQPRLFTLLPFLRRSFSSSPLAKATGRTPGGRPWAAPKRSWWYRFQERVDLIPWNWVKWGLIGLNVLVYIQWKIGIQNYTRYGEQQPLLFLVENFTTSWENYQAGRIWTLVTSCFSQQDETHLLINCFILWASAPSLLLVLGSARFLGVYLLGGAVSSAVSVWWRAAEPGYSLGASGATYAALSLFACMFPRSEFALFGIIPMPAWACIGGIFLWDFFWMIAKTKGIGNTPGGSDNAGHVGGMLAGAAMFFLRFRSYVPRM